MNQVHKENVRFFLHQLDQAESLAVFHFIVAENDMHLVFHRQAVGLGKIGCGAQF